MDYKVKLEGEGATVIFQASVPVSESRSANYDGYSIVQLPTSLWAYRNTNGRHFSVSGKLVSRTPNEATANSSYLTAIRSWIQPGFGTTGSTPPLVYLSAYNNTNIKRVPCVMVSYSWTFVDDVDYIYGGSDPMPVIGVVTVELDEAYSAEQITAIIPWKISPRNGGSFSWIGEPGTASSSTIISTTMPSFDSGFGGLASSSTSLSTLGNALSIDPMSIAQMPQMLGQTGAAVSTSPYTSSVQEAVGSLGNQFINGNSPSTVYGNSVTSAVSPVSASIGVTDSFGRNVPTVTSLIGNR